jgi:uncharacterized protein YfiM (DUF2279 family)
MENGMTFIPNIWTTRDQCLSHIWTGNVNSAISNYYTDSLIAFNEPDMGTGVGSSSLSIGEAVDGYRKLMQPFSGRVSLGAPATTYTGRGSEGGWAWK